MKRKLIRRSDKEIRREKEIRQKRMDIYHNDTILFTTCFALAEHNLYGFGKKRITRSLNYMSDLMYDVYSGKETIDTLIKRLYDETGIIIQDGENKED